MTTLDPAYALYSNLKLAVDFEEGTGNVVNLVTGSAVGTFASGSSRTTDGTYGHIVNSDGSTGGINFGDLNAIEGHSQFSLFIWQKSDISETTTNRQIAGKVGGSDDTLLLVWQASENLSGSIDQGATSTAAVITDGLHPTINVNPTGWHAVGITWDGSTLTTIADNNTTKATNTAALVGGAMNNTPHDLIFHSQWDGQIAFIYVFDVGLTTAQWDALVDNPALPIAAAASFKSAWARGANAVIQ